jgi:hypothetical protein
VSDARCSSAAQPNPLWIPTYLTRCLALRRLANQRRRTELSGGYIEHPAASTQLDTTSQEHYHHSSSPSSRQILEAFPRQKIARVPCMQIDGREDASATKKSDRELERSRLWVKEESKSGTSRFEMQGCLLILLFLLLCPYMIQPHTITVLGIVR